MTSKKQAPNYNNSIGVMIGGAASPDSVRELRAAIMDILTSGAEQETLRRALDVLSTGVVTPDVSNTSISNSTFNTTER